MELMEIDIVGNHGDVNVTAMLSESTGPGAHAAAFPFPVDDRVRQRDDHH